MLAYFRTPHVDPSALVLRFGLAVVFITHGWIKVDQALSWTDLISREMQQVVGWGEFVCGIALALGFLSRLAALGLIVIQAGAIYYVTGGREFINIQVGRHGFNFKASGYEYNFLIIVMCVAVMLLGSGRYSIDHLLFGRRKSRVVRTAAPPAIPTEAMSRS